MLQRVVEKVIEVQQMFFLRDEALNPLKLEDVAKALGVNVSTVSRAIAGKYLICEQGVYPLKHFLSERLKQTGENDVSSDYIRRKMKEMLEQNPNLSDGELCGLLNEHGISIARRTVAKYRARMGIGSVYERKSNEHASLAQSRGAQMK